MELLQDITLGYVKVLAGTPVEFMEFCGPEQVAVKILDDKSPANGLVVAVESRAVSSHPAGTIKISPDTFLIP
jgi:hypothetical protein